MFKKNNDVLKLFWNFLFSIHSSEGNLKCDKFHMNQLMVASNPQEFIKKKTLLGPQLSSIFQLTQEEQSWKNIYKIYLSQDYLFF